MPIEKNPRRLRRRAISLAAMAMLGVCLWWWSADGGHQTPQAEIKSDRNDAAPVLEGHPAWARALSEMGAGPPARVGEFVGGENPRQGRHTVEFRCSGRVVDEAGAALSDVIVSVSTVHDSGGHAERALLAQAITSSDGAFDFPVLLPDAAAGVYYLIAYRNGFSRVQRAVEAPSEPSSWEGITITLAAGGSLRGVLLHPDGQPLAGVPLLITSRTMVPTTSRRRSLLLTDDDLLHFVPGGYWECRVVTDERGEFTGRGLGDAQYTVWSLDERWFLPPPAARYRPIDALDPVQIRAAACRTLDFTVRGRRTGGPVPVFEGELRVRTETGTSKMIPVRGREGVYDVCWLDPAAGEERCSVAVAIHAPGYEVGQAQVEFAPGQAAARVDLLLAEQALGTVLLHVVDAMGAPAEGPLLANFMRAPERRERLSDVVLRPGDVPGVFHAQVAEGRWFAHVFRSNELARLGGWKGEVRAFPAPVLPMRVALPEEGTLELVAGAGWPDSASASCPVLLVASGGAMVGSATFRGGATTFHGVPPGRWTLHWMPSGAARQAEVVIVAGEVARMHLEP